ncbi:DUF2624 family protein [Alteribacillus sp. YIM 98480]|uniref:DUF2624 family protein n=1 Tax=Alteribacillus sp. YIM 98480 TaxID=2606599 RepID=UPI00131C489F|nr:DUF2624 family protein [Alteribacillus sp. YIM 98480]
MNRFKDQWIKYKISELHPKDLIHYGALYGVTVSFEEASDLLHLVQSSHWSIDDKQSMTNILEEAKETVSPETYALLKQLFKNFIG